MRNFSPFYEKVEKEAEQRGYRMSDMAKSRELVNRSRREWAHRFHSHVDSLTYHADQWTPASLVKYAKELADWEESTLDLKFPEGVELEE